MSRGGILFPIRTLDRRHEYECD